MKMHVFVGTMAFASMKMGVQSCVQGCFIYEYAVNQTVCKQFHIWIRSRHFCGYTVSSKKIVWSKVKIYMFIDANALFRENKWRFFALLNSLARIHGIFIYENGVGASFLGCFMYETVCRAYAHGCLMYEHAFGAFSESCFMYENPIFFQKYCQIHCAEAFLTDFGRKGVSILLFT